MRSLVSAEARPEIARLVDEIEKRTAAEIVVALRPRSGDYRAADLGFGAFVALLVLCLFLYLPEPFDFTLFPLEQLFAFGLGAVACSYLAPLRRLLTRREKREENVARSARAMFLEQGIDRTMRRTGILVYLSTFERRVQLVLDRGIDRAALAGAIASCEEALSAALRRGKLEPFADGLAAFGDALAKVHPVHADDEDELPDEVVA